MLHHFRIALPTDVTTDTENMAIEQMMHHILLEWSLPTKSGRTQSNCQIQLPKIPCHSSTSDSKDITRLAKEGAGISQRKPKGEIGNGPWHSQKFPILI